MIKIFYIFFIILIFLSNCYSIDDSDKSQLIDRIEASLIVNLYESVNQFSMINIKEDFKVNLEFEDLNDSLMFADRNYSLYSYEIELIDNEQSIKLIESFDEVHLKKYKAVWLLHKQGLIGVNERESRNDVITISGNSIMNYNYLAKNLDYSKLTRTNTIELKYYNYSPININIDTNINEFTFYSEILDRNFEGKLIYDYYYEIYRPELNNGVLLHD